MNADPIEVVVVNGLLGAAANIALLLGSYWIARHGFRQPRGLPVLMATAVVFWVAVTLGLLALGTFEALGVGPMLAWGVIVGVIGGIFRWQRADAGSEPATARTSGPAGWDVAIPLGLVLAPVLILGMRSLLLGVKVVSDGPIYHLYFAARWWQAGRLFLVASPFGENAATYFPANGDLWFTWLLATWGGERLAKLGQAPFLVLAGLAAYGCARWLGASRSASLIGTCWFATSTPLLLFSFEPNVDTIFVAGYLIAAYFFLRGSSGAGSTAAYCLGALAAGEALGTKAVGVVFVPPLLCMALVAVWGQSAPARTKIVRTVIALIGPLVPAGFWYVRNTLLTGNPLYPLEVRLLGQTILPGWYLPEAMTTSPYYLPVTEWRALGDTLLAVVDPRMAPIWIVALAAGWALKKPMTADARLRAAIFAMMAVLNVVFYWVFIPYRTQQRFMLQALGLAVVPLALMLDRVRWLSVAAVILLALHVCTPQGWPFVHADGQFPWDLSPHVPNAVSDPLSLNSRIGAALHETDDRRSLLPLALLIGIVATAIIMVRAWSRVFAGSRPFSRRGWVVAALGSSALFLALGVIDAGPAGLDSRLAFYPPFPDFIRGWLTLESRSGSAGSRVAYAGTNIPYYLFGQGLRNQVRYINIDGHRDWLLHDYHRQARAEGKGSWPNSRPGWDRIRPDYRSWLDNLDAEKIQLVVITRVNPAEGAHNAADSENFPIERQWADAHPDRFEPLYGARERDPWFRLYRVRRSTSER